MTAPKSEALHWRVKLLRTGIAVLAVFVAPLVALSFFPELSILVLAAKDKTSPYCTAWGAVSDAKVKLRRNGMQKTIFEQSHALRKDGNFKLWATPYGEFWVPDTNDQILSILLAQQQDKIYGDASSGGVKAGDIVLDGGAHVGVFVKTALDAGAEKVIAIEPSPEAVECLRRNFAKQIDAGKVIVYPKGIWDEEKRLVLYHGDNGGAGDSFLDPKEHERPIADIPVTTVDRIVKELRLPRVDLIKADIKGAGTRMIVGGEVTIRTYHPRIVISTEEPPEDPAAIRAAIMKIAPNYQLRPGPCLFGEGEVRNDTLFFQ
jgi:FkbM family methyltransferase